MEFERLGVGKARRSPSPRLRLIMPTRSARGTDGADHANSLWVDIDEETIAHIARPRGRNLSNVRAEKLVPARCRRDPLRPLLL